MKKIIFISIIVKILCIGKTDAQNFFPLNSGFNAGVRSLFYDTSSNILYAGGNFWTLGDNITPMVHISRWNGSNWDSLGAGAGGNIYAFAKYQNLLLVGGAYFTAGGIVSKGIAGWDGNAWQHFADAGACVFSLFVNGNDLYACGCFDSINGIPAQGVARYDGAQWHYYPILDPVNTAFVNDIVLFNNELYVAGNFDGGPGLKDIVKFDGTNWVTVAGGLSGFGTLINKMLVYQGELYIVGDFQISNGNPGNGIAKWNGALWSSLGSGLSSGGQLFSIIAFKNEIYVGGLFPSIGGVSSPFIAKWNGSNWNSLGSMFNNDVLCFASHGNDLYIGGGFTIIDNDTMNFITRYSSPLAIEENTWNTSGISITPNPNNGNFSLTSLFYPIESIRLFDLSGRVIFSKDKVLSNSYQCKLNATDGIYIAEVFVNGSAYRSKMVVVH